MPNIGDPCAILSRMESIEPALSQAAEANNRYLSPALGIIQTARGYFQTLRPERNTAENTAVPLHNLSSRAMSATEFEPDKVSERGNADRERVQQLMTSRELVRYVPPSNFPPNLPRRPAPKKGFNRWKLAFFGMLFAFIAAVTPLSVLVARSAFHHAESSLGRQPERLRETVTQTMTSIANPVTVTSIATQMRPTYVTITEVSIRTATLAETNAPKSTGLGSTCDDKNVFLANKFCIMVTECNQAKFDNEANDCKDFCRVQNKCRKSEQGSLSQSLYDCCGHCGCWY
jgi:hypothetical protein